ncbi:hypothetical protein [Cryobacterium cryoconiti]|uniref:Uncharacterized protein n=1 Tax=Cryobacterium cryoconiti TaxID=1259239 RepID=A0A4Y8JWX7_9MICO|nr:hypothetical protein [Cryobacterium cryoconiti]TFD32264.1 hypothetical protein E3T49_04685 [Cryobacterium cryoconiti]
MLHANDAISFRGGRRVFHSAVLAALTMAAMLLCLLAVHSAGTGHGPGHSLSAATPATTATTASALTTVTTAAAATVTTAAATTTAMAAGAHSAATHTASSATAAVVVVTAGAVSNVGAHAASDLAALSMTCSLLLVLGGLILLSRRPSVCRRLLEVVGFVVGSCRDIPLHLHRPSLTLLSISRI